MTRSCRRSRPSCRSDRCSATAPRRSQPPNSGSRTRTSDRLFLFVHLYEPHKPYAPPARFAQYAPYDGEIAYADELVGRLLDRLRRRKLFDRATIVLLADHGEGLGDHGEQEHGMFLYDETMHVPLIVKLPGQHRGRRVAAPVQHIDVAPTLLALAGIAAPTDLHGRNLTPLLDGSGTIPDAGIYAEAMLPAITSAGASSIR